MLIMTSMIRWFAIKKKKNSEARRISLAYVSAEVTSTYHGDISSANTLFPLARHDVTRMPSRSTTVWPTTRINTEYIPPTPLVNALPALHIRVIATPARPSFRSSSRPSPRHPAHHFVRHPGHHYVIPTIISFVIQAITTPSRP